MAENFTTNISELGAANKRVIEVNAAAQGISPEQYLASRGGLNPVTGKYGDSYTAGRDLTTSEYQAAVKGKVGIARGSAINEATNQKNYYYLISQGYSPTRAAQASGWSPSGVIPQTTGGNGGTITTDAGGYTGGVDTTVSSTAPTTNVEILKATLRGLGYNPQLIDSSASYLQQLLKEGLDYDNATEVFLNTKEYTLKNGTKITSPFYAAYGYLNESAKTPRSASELYGFVEGTKSLVQKYGLNTKFMSEDALKKYVGNGVTVADLEERANTARLKALESDTSYVEALKKLGFIGAASDLTDFYLDPNIGKSTLEENRRTGLFASEALRRAAQGVSMDAAFAKQIAAGLTAKGLSEAQIQATAAEGYANIAENLGTTTKLTGIYDRAGMGAQRQDVLQAQIQSELQQEEFMGMASAARKRAKEMETRAFEAAPGIGRYGLSQKGTAGII